MVEGKIYIIKRGSRPNEEFDPEKLHKSIVSTCLSVHTPEAQAEEIAKAVTLSVMKWCQSKSEITSYDIRRRALAALKPLHVDAAYLYQHHKAII